MAREMPLSHHRTQKYDHGIGQICPTLKAVNISADCGNPDARPPIHVIYSQLHNGIKFAIVEIGLRREELHYDACARDPREMDRLPYGFREIARMTKVEPRQLAQIVIDNAPKPEVKDKQRNDYAHIGARRP